MESVLAVDFSVTDQQQQEEEESRILGSLILVDAAGKSEMNIFSLLVVVIIYRYWLISIHQHPWGPSPLSL